MSKIIDKIRALQAEGGEAKDDGNKPFIAFECVRKRSCEAAAAADARSASIARYYPPRTDDGVTNLYARLGRMAKQGAPAPPARLPARARRGVIDRR